MIGALQLLNKPDGFSEEDAELLRFTALYSASAINAERMRREAESVRLMRHELDLAREVQRGLLPQDLQPVRGIEYAGVCRPARSVGGDYYDFLELPGALFSFILGDVSGKGIPAAVLMASIQTLLRSLLMHDPLPVSDVMDELNTAIHRCSSPQFYTTLFSAVLNADRTTLTYVNAGHIPPMVLRAGPEARIDRTTSGSLAHQHSAIDAILGWHHRHRPGRFDPLLLRRDFGSLQYRRRDVGGQPHRRGSAKVSRSPGGRDHQRRGHGRRRICRSVWTSSMT